MVRRLPNPGHSRPGPRLASSLSQLHLFDQESAAGPLRRDEALLFHALTRVLRPAVVVEIGFLEGFSALNFLEAMPAESKLYAFDISEHAERLAARRFGSRPNFRFCRRSQDEIVAADVDDRRIDLLLLDASHEFALNQRTFERVKDLLAEDGVLVVHDTGTWQRRHLHLTGREPPADDDPAWVTGEEFEHRPEERAFVNLIFEAHPEFAQLHLHSTGTLRHGMTLLQRRRRLPTTFVDGAFAPDQSEARA